MFFQKEIKILVFALSFFFAPKILFAQFETSDYFDQCILWLKSDTGVSETNGIVDSWNDLSGNDNNYGINNVAFRPQLNNFYKLNNEPSIKFDGQNDRLYNASIDSINEYDLSIFIVSFGRNQEGSGARAGIFSVNNFNNGLICSRELASENLATFVKTKKISSTIGGVENTGFEPVVMTYQRKIDSIAKIYLNGILESSIGNAIHVSPFVNGGSYLGYATGFASLKGDLAEILIFKQFLSSQERQEVESYLMDKYAPPVNLGADIYMPYGFCDTSLSSPSYYSSYLWSNGSTDSTITIDTQGLYWLESVDVFGRTSRDSTYITIPNRDSLSLEGQLICFNVPTTVEAFIPTGAYFFEEWSDGNTNPSRMINQSDSLFYTVRDSFNCPWSSDTAYFEYDVSLANITLGPNLSVCQGNTIQLTDTPNGILDFQWNSGDTNSSQVIDTSGTYILNVNNTNGCQNSDTIEVSVIGTAPALNYSIENEICQNSELIFNENSTVPPGNTISEIIWDFGLDDSVYVSSGTIIYADSGVYNGFIEVFTLEGCSSKETFNITVYPKPILSFATENYCPYEDVNFIAFNEYDVPLNSFSWNFNQGGNTSDDSSPLYNFNLTGNYNVELVAIDSNQCADTVIQTVFVQPAPVADIAIADPCESSPLQVIDNSTIADTFAIDIYAWEYGDNSTAINPIEDKYYETFGNYDLQLIITGNNGCMDTISQSITVHPNPIINYQVGPACQNTLTKFDDMSTIPQGSIISTDWLFNLQYEDDAASAYFNFPTTGIQLVSLSSTSDQGCSVDTTFTIDVSQELNANFNVSPEILVSDIPITFTNTNVGADSSYWDFGDADGLNYNNAIENSITYSSLLNGTSVEVILITANDLGCRDTISKTLLVNEALYDINLETLFTQDINGFLTVGVEIENLGTIPLENLNLILKTPENGPIKENWSGSIVQSESEIYIFNTQPSAFISDQDPTERFLCVEAQNANFSPYLDLNQENNTKCKNIEGEGLILLSMFPNPSNQDINISTLLTKSASLKIEFIDQTGRIAYKELTPELLKGIYSFNIPFSKFEKGVYNVRISDGESILMNKMIRY